MPEENIQRTYYLVLGQCTKILKIKIKLSTGWIKAFTTIEVQEIFIIINYIIYKLKYQNYLPILIHKTNMNFYILHQGKVINADYLKRFKNTLEIESEFKG